jgi:deferrochelatase/peroxidase EfeB
MSHSFITVALPIASTRLTQVREYLSSIGSLFSADATKAAVGLRADLDKTNIIHFLSVNVVPVADFNDPAEDEDVLHRDGYRMAYLLIEVSADGASETALEHAAQILERYLPDLLTLGMPNARSLHDVMKAHQHRIGQDWCATLGLTFTGTPEMTVVRIREEARLAREISKLLSDRKISDLGSALRILQAVRQILWDERSEKWAFVAEPIAWHQWKPPSAAWLGLARGLGATGLRLIWPFLMLVMCAFLLGYIWNAYGLGDWFRWGNWEAAFWYAGVVLLAGIILITIAYFVFRRNEERDAAPDIPPQAERVGQIMSGENYTAQNHLFSISPMKAGWLRLLTLRLALTAISQVGAVLFRPGYLADIGTIHFARWILLRRPRKLVFLSNYGGSWESYLEDFIQKASEGITGIWSNTRHFPRTRYLFLKGATDGDRFKRWARRQQYPTLIWYSAYPSLTTARIRVNAVIRQGIATAKTEAEATDWLACFGSAPRPPAQLETSDIPTLVFGGLSIFPYGIAMILSLAADNAKQWLRDLEKQLTYGDRLPSEVAMLLALSASGLKKLGQSDLSTFPAAFQNGMTVPWRARALGDEQQNAPEKWIWGGPGREADAVLLIYSKSEHALADRIGELERAFAAPDHRIIERVRFKNLPDKYQKRNPAGNEGNYNLVVVHDEEKYNRDFPKEHFGFADGVSQPIIRGTRRWVATRDANHVVAPGEIVLGYPDNRGYIPPSPSVPAANDPLDFLPAFGSDPFRERPDFSEPQPTARHDLGHNGTFLVVRQLQQNIDGFRQFVSDQANELAGDMRAPPDPNDREEWVAAKLVGRWKDGTSLVRFPNSPGTKHGRSARPDNDFLYGRDDPNAERCPFGAHIRRANPRDSLAPEPSQQLAISNRHRILRVGRSYGEEDKPPHGLFFMCLNADIERQFEFVQQTWAAAPSFHGLESEVDCFSCRGTTEAITIPTSRGPVFLKRLGDFVTVRGGGYFFMPSHRATMFLAN